MRGAAQDCCTSVPLYSSQARAWSKSSLGFRWILKNCSGDVMQWNVCQDVRIYGVSALWLPVIPESVHLYCTCICLLVWMWVCARARGCVWLSLTASMGTRFILTLIMSKRLAMPLSHFSISSILPVRLGYTFSSLLPFLPSLNHQRRLHPICPSLRLSPVSTLPPTFVFVFRHPQWSYGCLDRAAGWGGHCNSIVFTPCLCLSLLCCFNVCSSSPLIWGN